MYICVFKYFQNLPFDDGNLKNKNQFLGNEESPLDSDRPIIRIRINTNGGNAAPYSLLRRRPNSNMRLRIKQGTNSNNGLFRIQYRRKHQSISQTDDHKNEQPRQETRQRIILRPETRDTSKKIIIQSRRPSKLRIASGMLNNIRFRQY